MTESRDMRASDADRAETAERLRRAASEGRLLGYELDERMEAALLARTYGELDALVTDLPVVAEAPGRIDRPRRRRAALLAAFMAALAAVAIAVILLASRPPSTPYAHRVPTYALIRVMHIIRTKEHHFQLEIHVVRVRRPALPSGRK